MADCGLPRGTSFSLAGPESLGYSFRINYIQEAKASVLILKARVITAKFHVMLLAKFKPLKMPMKAIATKKYLRKYHYSSNN
jgi:hypothetical protein